MSQYYKPLACCCCGIRFIAVYTHFITVHIYLVLSLQLSLPSAGPTTSMTSPRLNLSYYKKQSLIFTHPLLIYHTSSAALCCKAWYSTSVKGLYVLFFLSIMRNLLISPCMVLNVYTTPFFIIIWVVAKSGPAQQKLVARLLELQQQSKDGRSLFLSSYPPLF